MAHPMTCVCDAHAPLLPVALSEGLPALMCEACQGHLLSLDDYRDWVAQSPDPQALTTTLPARPADEPIGNPSSTPVRRCPACSQLMTRLLSAGSRDFRLDRCGPCQWLWMDAGEWDSLVTDQVAHRLIETLSDGGQRALRAAASHQRREAELRARHGDEVIDDLIRIRAWLAEQPNPDLLLTLLRNGW
jgi:Zn-finger nucleic acid-binding protein